MHKIPGTEVATSVKVYYDVISSLERDIQSVTNWFKENSMVANTGKFQMMFLGKGTENEIIIEIDGVKITSSSSVRLLGVTLDKNLRFSAHIYLFIYLFIYLSNVYTGFTLQKIKFLLSLCVLYSSAFMAANVSA